MAVAAHHARLPLSFFHQIPSPPCHQPDPPALPETKTATATAGAPSNNAAERERPDLKPPLLCGEGGAIYGGCAGVGGHRLPPPGASAVGLYQGDNTFDISAHTGRRSPGGKGRESEHEEAAGGKELRRIRDNASGARTDGGTFCRWRRCLVKRRAAAEVRDAAVVVEWDDEAGGQVRRADVRV